MKKDRARKLTDKRLHKMEKKLKGIYKQSLKELEVKWNVYFNSIASRVDDITKELNIAIRTGDKDAIKELTYERRRLLRNLTLDNKRYQDIVDEIAEKMAHVNEVALNYINGQMAPIYTWNYNQFSSFAGKIGYEFTFVNEETIRHLATNNHSLLPYKKLNVQKDVRWNKKMLNSQVLQGIMQGESIDKISKRLQNVSDMDYKSAVRNARTMTTCSENKGRQASATKAKEDGVNLVKYWISTYDDRTRVLHSMLDGQEREPEEYFEIDDYELLYPGDATAPPEIVYNCRCTIGYRVKGFEKR